MFVCGLPGYGPGDLMVAYIDDDEVVVEMADYFSSPVRLTTPEALGLLASGMAISSTGQAPDALLSGVAKLQQVLLPEGDEALVVDLTEPEMVGMLRKAAADGAVVTISYTAIATGATSVRDIEPWTVFSTLGNWYVSAWCRSAEAERVFRVDRIQSLEPTGRHFEPPVEPPPPVVHYTPGEEDVRAVIRLSKAARWVVDYYPADVIEDTDDATTIRLSTSDPMVAARLLLRLGGEAELIDGSEVGEALGELRERILRRYGGGEWPE